jgi:hypothetical protein
VGRANVPFQESRHATKAVESVTSTAIRAELVGHVEGETRALVHRPFAYPDGFDFGRRAHR